MNIFDLERIVKSKKADFYQLVIDTFRHNGIDETLRLVKKSGICVNEFGTGHTNDLKLYNKIKDFLSQEAPNIFLGFENEVNIINDLYKNLSIKIKETDEEIADEIKVISYLMALEIFLYNCLENPDLSWLNVKINSPGLKHLAIDIYENALVNSGLILKYFYYKKYPFHNVYLQVKKEDIDISYRYMSLSNQKDLLNRVYDLWRYFELDTNSTNETTIFKASGSHALGLVISQQIFFDIRNAKMTKFVYRDTAFRQSYNKRVTQLPPKMFFSSQEELACELIYEYMSIDNLDIEFSGASIAEMIRAYIIVGDECDKFLKKRRFKRIKKSNTLSNVCLVKTREFWIRKFIDSGIRNKSAHIIIDFMTFDDTSVDINDCPFLIIDKLCVTLPSSGSLIDPSRALISNLNNIGVNLAIKGNLFENYIRTLINQSGVNCIRLHEKNVEEYECDAVFVLNEDLFFVEVKHLHHPLTYRDYMRYLDEIEAACKQLTRVTEYFLKRMDMVKEKLSQNIIRNVHKILVTNTALGERLIVDGCIITDETAFSGYFKRRPPTVNVINDKSLIVQELFTTFFTGELNSKQFINFLKECPLLMLNQKRIGFQTYDCTKSLKFILEDYISKVDTFVFPEKLTKDEQSNLSNIFI